MHLCISLPSWDFVGPSMFAAVQGLNRKLFCSPSNNYSQLANCDILWSLTEKKTCIYIYTFKVSSFSGKINQELQELHGTSRHLHSRLVDHALYTDIKMCRDVSRSWHASWTQPRFFSGAICFHIAKAALASTKHRSRTQPLFWNKKKWRPNHSQSALLIFLLTYLLNTHLAKTISENCMEFCIIFLRWFEHHRCGAKNYWWGQLLVSCAAAVAVVSRGPITGHRFRMVLLPMTAWPFGVKRVIKERVSSVWQCRTFSTSRQGGWSRAGNVLPSLWRFEWLCQPGMSSSHVLKCCWWYIVMLCDTTLHDSGVTSLPTVLEMKFMNGISSQHETILSYYGNWE